MKVDKRKSCNIILILLSVGLTFSVLFGSSVQAHPMHYHMQPLDKATVARVVKSLSRMIDDIRRNGSLDAVRIPGDAMGITVLLWSIQDAMMAIDDAGTVDSPGMKRALISAGYEDSRYVVEEWQADAEQVLETYEVVGRGLSIEGIRARHTAFLADQSQLDEEQVIEVEGALIRDRQLLRTTVEDVALIRQFKPQLDAVASQLGIPVP